MPGKDFFRLLPGQSGGKSDCVFSWPTRFGHRRCFHLEKISGLSQQLPPAWRGRSENKGSLHRLSLVEARPRTNALAVADRQSHTWCIVRDPVAPVGTEQDDPAMALETSIEIGDGVFSGLLRPQLRYPVDRPLAQHQLHDGLAPAGQRGSRAAVVGVAPTADDRRVSY